MKTIFKIVPVLAILALASCGEKDGKKEKETIKLGGSNSEKEIVESPNTDLPKAGMIDMSNKGIGPIKNVTIPAAIDQAMVAQGFEIYKSKCMACHKPDKKFIGPAPTGVLERRSPEWVMNMILNPEEMTQKDPIAKALMIEYNGSPMANQGLSEADARNVLEYFRTLK